MTPQGRRTPLPSTHRVRTECNEAGNVKATRAELIEAADKAALALGLACTARTLLLRLAACYGEQNISQGLMVWPSNAALPVSPSIRTTPAGTASRKPVDKSS